MCISVDGYMGYLSLYKVNMWPIVSKGTLRSCVEYSAIARSLFLERAVHCVGYNRTYYFKGSSCNLPTKVHLIRKLGQSKKNARTHFLHISLLRSFFGIVPHAVFMSWYKNTTMWSMMTVEWISCSEFSEISMTGAEPF